MQERDFDLDPGQWATLRRLLDEALEREPAQRAAWLETLDGPLAEFKPRLRELLEHAEGTSHGRMGTLPKVETADFAPLLVGVNYLDRPAKVIVANHAAPRCDARAHRAVSAAARAGQRRHGERLAGAAFRHAARPPGSTQAAAR
jgi:hypothetical protein